MARILILGCSLSMGSYGSEPPELVRGPDDMDKLMSDIGWYHHIPQLVGHQLHVYGVGGGGYMDWAQIVLELHEQAQMQRFKQVIIAETTYDRFALWRPDHAWHMDFSSLHGIEVVHYRSSPAERCLLTSNPRQMQVILQQRGLDITDQQLDWLLQLRENTTARRVHDMAMMTIQMICARLSIPIVVFSFFEAQLAVAPGITRLADQLYENLLLADRHNLTALDDPNYMPHQTIQGNRAIGQLLSSVWPGSV